MKDDFEMPAPKIKPATENESSKESTLAEIGVLNSKYQEPDWAAEKPPTHDDENHIWRLEILKNGIPIGFIDLSAKPRFVLGRQGDGMCDSILEHQSISRQHAVLQHHKEGSLWMMDLASTHGSYLNKRRILPNAFVQIRPGDVLKFGDSQRLYLVHGPEEMRPLEQESTNLAQVRHKLNQRRLKEEERKNAKSADAMALAELMRARQGDVESNGISWGLSADEVKEEQGEEEGEDLPDYLKNGKVREKIEHSTSLGNEERSKKDEELWQRLQAKIQKQNNLEEENRRILSKEGGMVGLSDGQRRQVDRNEERLASLEEEVAELEERIRGKNLQRGESRKNMNKKKAGQRDEDDDEDDFFDRTKAAPQENRRKRGAKQSRSSKLVTSSSTAAASSSTNNNLPNSLVGKTLTEELLSSELEKNISKIEELNHSLMTKTSSLEVGNDAVDELTAFMRANESITLQQERDLMSNELEVLKGQQHTLKALLKVAAPALEGLSRMKSSSVSTTTSPASTTTASSSLTSSPASTPASITDTASSSTEDPKKKEDNELKRKATLASNEEETIKQEKNETNDLGKQEDEDAKLKKVRTTHDDGKDSTEASHDGKAVKSIKIGAPVEPFLSSSSSPQPNSGSLLPTTLPKTAKRTVPLGPTMNQKQTPVSRKRTQKRNSKTTTKPDIDHGSESLESEELWCPPPDQTGDGKTHLNDRFGY